MVVEESRRTQMQNELTISELFTEMGFPYENLEINKSIDVSQLGYEVKTKGDHDQIEWQLIKSIIKKEKTESYVIPECSLTVSPMHLFWAKVENSEPHWIETCGLIDCEYFELFHESKGWINATIKHDQKQTEILDIEVENTHCYYTNGVLSHNTTYGDPQCVDPVTTIVKIRAKQGTKMFDILNSRKKENSL